MWSQAGQLTSLWFSPLKVWSMAWHEMVYQPGFTKEKSKQLEVLKQGFSCSKFLLRLGEVKLLSCVWLLVIPWTVAPQAPLSIEFSRQEYWSGLPFPSPSFIFHCTCHCRRLSDLGDSLLPPGGQGPAANGYPHHSCRCSASWWWGLMSITAELLS